MLILAHRPFPAPQPYAELGPIFLCADAERCHAPECADDLPEILASPDYIVRGYSRRSPDRLRHRGGGADRPDRGTRPRARLADPRVAYVHVRSARNNCYQVRIDRA